MVIPGLGKGSDDPCIDEAVAALSHLAKGYREQALWPDKERIAWIRKDRWLGFPKADTVRTMLHDLLEHPPRTRMPCLLVFAKTGMGKSNIVNRFADPRQRPLASAAERACERFTSAPGSTWTPCSRATRVG